MTRTSIIHHKATGVSVTTPLLVPSFSSRGFKQGASPGDSDVMKWLKVASQFLDRPYLISAYDIAEGFVPGPNELPYNPDILFVDSGGYEVSELEDLSAVKPSPPGLSNWNRERLIDVQANWPSSQPAVFVSYDHPDETLSFDGQLARAIEDARRLNGHLNTFLIKPATKSGSLSTTLKEARIRADELRGFDIIGVTEKEAGRSMFERMKHIAQLRRDLNEAQVVAPIHVFGSLDPVSTCLYFIAGAEIFDGLTWLRYAYSDDNRCVYIHNHGPLAYDIEDEDRLVQARTITQNFNKLTTIERLLRHFAADGNIEMLPNSDLMIAAKRKLENSLRKG